MNFLQSVDLFEDLLGFIILRDMLFHKKSTIKEFSPNLFKLVFMFRYDIIKVNLKFTFTLLANLIFN